MKGDYKLARNFKHGITMRKIILQTDGFMTWKSHAYGKLLNSIMRVSRENYQYEHPTQKPVQLLRLLIELITEPNMIILDPFAGSGSLAVAAYDINRDYICIEIDKEYYKNILKRVNNHTKQGRII
jgi:site-specific DNA-methyltransferase (adenine-specific)